MRSVARLAALGSAFALGACAVIAGLDDPAAVDDSTSASSSGGSSSGSVQDTGNGSSSGAASSSGSTASDSSSDGASSSGSAADATPDVATCPELKIGDTCNANSQCCSKKCSENRQCASECKPSGSFNCTPGSTSECCVGLWCNVGSCSACVPGGQAAAQPAGFPWPASCCSRTLAGGIGPNCQ